MDEKKTTLAMEESLGIALEEASRDLLSYGVLMEDPFEINWHHRLITDRLMMIYEGLNRRAGLKKLMIALPPQWGTKSTLVSKLFMSWVLGNKPKTRVLFGAYNSQLAKLISGDAKRMTETDTFKDIFGRTTQNKRRSDMNWGLTGGAGGGVHAMGLKTSMTGHPADLIILDDPIKGEEIKSKAIRDSLWSKYTKEVLSRIRPETALILIFTRWHLDDIVGRIEKQLQKNGSSLKEDGWEVLHIPAEATEDLHWKLSTGEKVGYKKGEGFWENRYTKEDLKRKKADVGHHTWQCLYQQNPVSEKTHPFKASYFQSITEESVMKEDTVRFLAIDPSTGEGDDDTGFADVRINTRTNKWYVHGWKEKIGSLELVDRIFGLRMQNRYHRIGIEGQLYEKALKPFFLQECQRRNVHFALEELKHHNRNKGSRISGLEPFYATGQIFHIEGKCSDLEEQLMDFPNGANDDLPDALAYVLDMVEDYNYNSEEDVAFHPAPITNYK